MQYCWSYAHILYISLQGNELMVVSCNCISSGRYVAIEKRELQ